MIIVRPLEFIIEQNTISKDNTAIWNKDKTYKINDDVSFKGYIYKSASDEDKHEEPDVYFDKWVKMRPTNENACFDDEVNTQSKDNKTWSVIIDVKESFDALAVLNANLSKIKIQTLDKRVIYEKSLFYRKSRTWWEYFFGRFKINKDDFIFFKYPINSKIKITFYALNDIANVGHILLGKKEKLGITIHPANLTYLNYSKTNTNEWGHTTVVDGKKAKFLEFIVALEKAHFDYYDDLIESIYNKKTLFIADESENGFKKLTTFGILKDYSAPIEDYDFLQIKLNIQGLI
ncbi:hypothetical protein KJQ81_06995 [Campylobacter lari]|uniref:Uncharacterized protein n=1 Tax=Campylobacter lari TaxID=201 RepID=A0A6N6BDH8_CAMLA|nr:hypothetical protein [Campylobacter lari]EDP6814206.1 hypothetical protein [Campylobacter lari]MBT0817928.1 hypothetical protein [Campylobacter lari]